MQHTQKREHGQLYKIYTIIEKPEGQKDYWLEIGIASVNRDGSLGGRLNALPVNGSIQLREFVPRNSERRQTGGSSNAPNGRYRGE